MAHLNRRDRGQLILVAGFALAVAFVALALVLNAAIFTGSLATRGENTGANDALAYRQTVETDVGELLQYANEVNASDSYGDLETNVTVGVNEMSNLSARLQVRTGTVSNVSLQSSVSGTRILQNDTTARRFTNESGDSDWTMAEGVQQTRAFTIEIDNDTGIRWRRSPTMAPGTSSTSPSTTRTASTTGNCCSRGTAPRPIRST
ncbi:hypothetical protein VB773_13045 [Haloarculaceae archaeon H-GB2-1]|nr:hypothetical protein [Haloarculaceae archaeon H-GB2-1]